ncbi:MAG: glycosyltransferase [Pirellulaceae bacterium]|nr:glycosyltransferase [Pirellulaceae bacterium]
MTEPLIPNSIFRAENSHLTSDLARIANRNKPVRIALYSHDTMGMGHIRRNLLIASSLVKDSANVEALLISGTREAAFFATQAGLDCVTLPALSKDTQGGYSARHFDWSLEKTVQLRSRIIAAAVDEFRPDIFIVDKIPLGIGNELESTMRLLKSHPTQCVLGLRDVLDEPNVVAREWIRDRYDTSIESYYDELWIYGDRAIYDCVHEYAFPTSVASRAVFTGYLNQTKRMATTPAQTNKANVAVPQEPFVLCVVGGGQDGFDLAQVFVQSRIPEGWKGIVITGPFMPKQDQQRLRELVGDRTNIEIIDRMIETDEYMLNAERVVAMGGYNTVTSVLSFAKTALIVPRTRPRREQWIRAERLAKKGWLTAVDPDSLTPEIMTNWLQDSDAPRPSPDSVDLQGLNRISARVAQLCKNKVTV